MKLQKTNNLMPGHYWVVCVGPEEELTCSMCGESCCCGELVYLCEVCQSATHKSCILNGSRSERLMFPCHNDEGKILCRVTNVGDEQ